MRRRDYYYGTDFTGENQRDQRSKRDRTSTLSDYAQTQTIPQPPQRIRTNSDTDNFIRGFDADGQDPINIPSPTFKANAHKELNFRPQFRMTTQRPQVSGAHNETDPFLRGFYLDDQLPENVPSYLAAMRRQSMPRQTSNAPTLNQPTMVQENIVTKKKNITYGQVSLQAVSNAPGKPADTENSIENRIQNIANHLSNGYNVEYEYGKGIITKDMAKSFLDQIYSGTITRQGIVDVLNEKMGIASNPTANDTGSASKSQNTTNHSPTVNQPTTQTPINSTKQAETELAIERSVERIVDGLNNGDYDWSEMSAVGIGFEKARDLMEALACMRITVKEAREKLLKDIKGEDNSTRASTPKATTPQTASSQTTPQAMTPATIEPKQSGVTPLTSPRTGAADVDFYRHVPGIDASGGAGNSNSRGTSNSHSGSSRFVYDRELISTILPEISKAAIPDIPQLNIQSLPEIDWDSIDWEEFAINTRERQRIHLEQTNEYLKNHIGGFFSSVVKDLASDITEILTTVYEVGLRNRKNEYEQILRIWDENLLSTQSELEYMLKENRDNPGSNSNEIIRAQIASVMIERMKVNLFELINRGEKITTAAYILGDELAAEAEKDLEKAKEGVGPTCQFWIDVGAKMADNAVNNVIGAMLGTGVLLPVAARTFADGSREARQNGVDFSTRVFYGAGRATVNYMLNSVVKNIESVGRQFEDVFGNDEIGKMVVYISDWLNNTPIGRIALSGLYEGGTYFVEGIFKPILQQATYDRSSIYDVEDGLRISLVAFVARIIEECKDKGFKSLVQFISEAIA